MEWVAGIWTQYWGGGFYQFLFLVSAVYLLIRKRKDSSIGPLLCYTVCILLVFACPVSAWIIRRCIGKSVYWRVLWLVPALWVTAIAAADLVRRRKKVMRILLVLVFAAVIALCGKDMIRAGNYVLVENWQQVPDEVAQICSMIRLDAGEDRVFLAADDHVASYARVYDPSFFMPYGRGGREAINKQAGDLYEQIMLGGDFGQVAALADGLECNYIVGIMHDPSQIVFLEEKGYVELGTVNDYRIFAKR